MINRKVLKAYDNLYPYENILLHLLKTCRCACCNGEKNGLCPLLWEQEHASDYVYDIILPNLLVIAQYYIDPSLSDTKHYWWKEVKQTNSTPLEWYKPRMLFINKVLFKMSINRPLISLLKKIKKL